MHQSNKYNIKQRLIFFYTFTLCDKAVKTLINVNLKAPSNYKIQTLCMRVNIIKICYKFLITKIEFFYLKLLNTSINAMDILRARLKVA